MKFYLSKSIRPAILFFLFFFKLIGLATFSVITVDRKKKQQKKTVYLIWTRFGMYYNILISCLIMASICIVSPILYYQQYSYKTIITTIIELAQGILGCSIMSVTLLYYCVNQSTLVKFGNNLIDVLDELDRLKKPVNRTRIVSILLSVYLFQLGLFSVALIIDHINYQMLLISWIPIFMPVGFLSWLFIQYYSTLFVIHAIFVKLNKIIQNVYVNRTADIRVNYLNRYRRVFISNTEIQSLLHLRCVHNNVCNISAEVLQFYSFPILLGTAHLFFALLYNVYYLFKLFMNDKVIPELKVTMNAIAWTILLLYPIGLLTTKVTKIDSEIEQTGSIVHTLLNRTIDREARTELKLFSLQLLHRKLKFTAVGYFDLDNTLFTSVISTLVTYLVILIQFQAEALDPTDRNCNCTRNCDD